MMSWPARSQRCIIQPHKLPSMLHARSSLYSACKSQSLCLLRHTVTDLVLPDLRHLTLQGPWLVIAEGGNCG
jgi:hypothetical protein